MLFIPFWLRSLQKGVETCEDEIFTFPKAWLEVSKKQSGHDTGLKTNNKKLADYKSRKEKSSEHFVGLSPCVKCQLCFLFFL